MMRRFHQFIGRFSLDCGGENQRGEFDFFDGIDIILDEGANQRVVETMRGRDNDVEIHMLESQTARAGDKVQEIKGFISAGIDVFSCQRRGGGARQELRLRGQRPGLRVFEDGGAQGGVLIELEELLVQLARQRRVVERK